MKRTVRTGEPASEELIDAVRWYEARRPGLGGEFLDAVAEMLALIEVRRHDEMPAGRSAATAG